MCRVSTPAAPWRRCRCRETAAPAPLWQPARAQTQRPAAAPACSKAFAGSQAPLASESYCESRHAPLQPVMHAPAAIGASVTRHLHICCSIQDEVPSHLLDTICAMSAVGNSSRRLTSRRATPAGECGRHILSSHLVRPPVRIGLSAEALVPFVVHRRTCGIRHQLRQQVPVELQQAVRRHGREQDAQLLHSKRHRLQWMWMHATSL